MILINASVRSERRGSPAASTRAGIAAKEGGEPRGYRFAVVAVARCADDALTVL